MTELLAGGWSRLSKGIDHTQSLPSAPPVTAASNEGTNAEERTDPRREPKVLQGLRSFVSL